MDKQNHGKSVFTLILDELAYRIVRFLHRRAIVRGIIRYPMIISSSDMIGHRIISTGSFESSFLEGLDHLIQNSTECIGTSINWGGAFVDVGANIGIYSTRYFSLFSETLAVEANPLTYDILRANIQFVDARNVKLVCVGASNTKGASNLQVATNGMLGWSRLGDDATWATKAVTIEVDLLDEIVKSNLINDRVALIKIDVEGHELQVLQGAARILQEDGPVVLYEALSGHAGQECGDLLVDAGYKRFYTMKRRLDVRHIWAPMPVDFIELGPKALTAGGLICAVKS